MPIFNQPTYPVLDRAPGFWKTCSGFNMSDCSTWAACTAASWPFGYVAAAGINSGVPRQSAMMAAVLGATAGFMLAYQGSSGRLMGYFPNDGEANSALQR